MLKTNHIDFHGARINYYTVGKGRTVVLLHGLLFSSEIWKPFIPVLSRSFKLIIVDLPGHGRSGFSGYYYSMEDLARIVNQVLSKLKVRKCVIAGHSLGGYIALTFAELFPSRLKGLCLLNATPFPDFQEQTEDRNKLVKIFTKDPGIASRHLFPLLFSNSFLKNDPDLEAIIHDASKIDPAVLTALAKGISKRKDLSSLITKLSKPIMVITGENDPIAPENSFRNFYKLPNFRIINLSGVGHLGFYEQSKISVKLIRRFCNRIFRNPKTIRA